MIKTTAPNWMEGVDDSTTLDRTSIPSTHDSCAIYDKATGGHSVPMVEHHQTTGTPLRMAGPRFQLLKRWALRSWPDIATGKQIAIHAPADRDCVLSRRGQRPQRCTAGVNPTRGYLALPPIAPPNELRKRSSAKSAGDVTEPCHAIGRQLLHSVA